MPKFNDKEPDSSAIPTDNELEDLPLSQLLRMRQIYHLKTGERKQQIISALSHLRNENTPSATEESFSQQVARDFPIPRQTMDFYRSYPEIPANPVRQASPPVLYNFGSSPSRHSFSEPGEAEQTGSQPRLKVKRTQVYRSVRQIRLTAANGRPLVSAKVVEQLDDSSTFVSIGPAPTVYPDFYYLNESDSDWDNSPSSPPPVATRQPLGCITRQFLEVEDIEYEEVDDAGGTASRGSSQRRQSIPDMDWESETIAAVPLQLSQQYEDDCEGGSGSHGEDSDPVENDENMPPPGQCQFVPDRREFLVRINLSDMDKLHSDRPSVQKTIGLLAGIINP